MKKIVILIVLLCSFISLSSCVGHKRNHFVEGFFHSIRVNDESEGVDEYYLEVKAIDYDTYVLSDGLNTVKDSVLKEPNCYFQITSYKIDEENIKTILNFYNLVDNNPNTKAVPANYIDENKNTIGPLYIETGEYHQIYSIKYKDEITGDILYIDFDEVN